MMYLLLVGFSLVLWGGFSALTVFETKKGVRFLSVRRDRFDELLTKFSFVIEHVDFMAWAKEETRRLIDRVSHDVAHLTLQGIRAVERLLTRVVKHLRTKEADTTPRETERPFIGALADFKTRLSATRPQISEIGKIG